MVLNHTWVKDYYIITFKQVAYSEYRYTFRVASVSDSLLFRSCPLSLGRVQAYARYSTWTTGKPGDIHALRDTSRQSPGLGVSISENTHVSQLLLLLFVL